jgi:hypothetical protein
MNRVFKDRLEKHIAELILADKLEKGQPYLIKESDLYGVS